MGLTFPRTRTNQTTSTKLYIATRKNAFDAAEVLTLLTFEIQQLLGFFVTAGLLELFTTYVRPREYQTSNAGLLERWETILKAKESGRIIREAVLSERAALLERIRYLAIIYCANGQPA